MIEVVTTRGLADRLLVIRTGDARGLTAQAAWPHSFGRSPAYLALAEELQVVIYKSLDALRKTGDEEAFASAIDEAAHELEFEDHKAVEVEKAAHGGKLPERIDRSVSVRAARAGLPSLGKRP